MSTGLKIFRLIKYIILLKILNVNLTLDTKCGGGTAERTFQMTRWLNRLGSNCKVLILNIGENNNRIFEIGDDNVFILKCLNKRFYIPELKLDQIKNAVKDVDLIHLMNHWTLLNVIVFIASKIYTKPYVICPAGALSYLGRSKFLKNFYNLVIGKRIIRDSAYCIAISRDEILELRKYGIQESKIIHIPNGINEEEYTKYHNNDFRFNFGLSKKKIILFVGRLNKIKGVDLLFNAFCNIHHQIPGYQLVIAGPDEGMRSGLDKKIKEHKLSEHIKFIGYLSTEYKSAAYNEASLLVIPSRQEAMSIVVLEAGITGTPVLITNRCGFNEIDDINGGKIVEATTNGIEQGLLQLLRDENQLIYMGANLRTHVKNNYLWHSIANCYLDLFNQVVKE